MITRKEEVRIGDWAWLDLPKNDPSYRDNYGMVVRVIATHTKSNNTYPLYYVTEPTLYYYSREGDKMAVSGWAADVLVKLEAPSETEVDEMILWNGKAPKMTMAQINKIKKDKENGKNNPNK